MKIAILCQHYPPEIGAAAIRVESFARVLSQRGHIVTVVTSVPCYPSGVIPPIYRKKPWHKETENNVIIYRLRTIGYSVSNKISRLLNQIIFAFIATIVLIKLSGKTDVIVISSPPLLSGVAALITKILRGIPYILDVRDIWPEIAVDMGETTRNSIFYRAGRFIEKQMYAKASRIIVVNSGKRDKLVSRGVSEDKIEIISNGVSRRLYANFDFQQGRKKNNEHKDFRVTYLGLIGKAQGIDILIEAAKELDEIPNIKIVIYGDGPERSYIRGLIDQMSLQNIDLAGLITQEEVPEALMKSNVNLAILKYRSLNDSIPSKLYEYMASGRPVILSADGEASRLIKKANSGFVVPVNDPLALANAIKNLYQSPELCRGLGENGRAYAKNYIREDLALKLEEVAFQVTGEIVYENK